MKKAYEPPRIEEHKYEVIDMMASTGSGTTGNSAELPETNVDISF